MKKQHLLHTAFLIFAGALWFSSCSDDVRSLEETDDAKTTLTFQVSVDNDWQGNTSTKAPLQSYSIASEEANQRILLAETLEKGINAQQSAKCDVKAMTRAMITTYGMSDRFGMVQLEQKRNRYLGSASDLTCSPKTAKAIDDEVARIVREAHAKAVKIITDNQDKMNAAAAILLKKETITGKEFMEVIGK